MEDITKILGSLKEIDPTKSYVFNVEVGDMPKIECLRMLEKLNSILKEYGIKNCIYIPMHNNKGGLITIDEWLDLNKENQKNDQSN